MSQCPRTGNTDTDTNANANTHPAHHPNTPDRTDRTIYKLTFFTPPNATQSCLQALHAIGAGVWPNPNPNSDPDVDPDAASTPKYVDSAFISRGTGQFRPAAHANPHIGTRGRIEVVEEDRVEMVVLGTETVRRAVAELRRVHPYEVVGLFVVRCEDF